MSFSSAGGSSQSPPKFLARFEGPLPGNVEDELSCTLTKRSFIEFQLTFIYESWSDRDESVVSGLRFLSRTIRLLKPGKPNSQIPNNNPDTNPDPKLI